MSGSHGPGGGVAKKVFEIVPGVWWPSADEDGLRAMAAAWRAAADTVEQVAGSAGTVVRAVTTQNQGPEFAALARFWGSVDNGAGAGHLPDVATACKQLADSCDNLAHEVAEAKHRVIVELTVAAAVIVASVATLWIPVVGEIAAGAAAVTAATLVTATAAIGVTLTTVAASIAATVIVGAVLGALTALTVDMVVAQPIKMAFGDQAWGHWNADEALAYAEGGFIGGGIGGGLAGVGQLAGAMSESMAATAPTLAKGISTVPDALTSGVGQVVAGSGINAATGYVLNGHVSGMDVVTGAAGGLAGHAVGPGAARGPLLDEVSPLADPAGVLAQAGEGGLRARLNGLNRLSDLINGKGALLPLPDGWQADGAFSPMHGDPWGGDFSLARLSEDGRTLDVVLGDATGHGVQAAPSAFALSDALSGVLEAHPGGEFMPAANTHVGDSPGYPVIPAQQLTLDLASGDYTLANAGSVPAGHYHAATGEWTILEPRGPMFGMIPDMVGTTVVGQLAPGDALLMYSDGMVEDRVGGIDAAVPRLLDLAGPLIVDGRPGTARAILESVPAGDDRSLFLIRRPVPG